MTTAPAFPQVPGRYAAALVAATMLILAYARLFNVIPILAFLGIWFGVLLYNFVYKRTFVLKPSRDMIAVLSFPFLCIYSTLWSEYRGATLYGGICLLLMVSCTVIITRTVAMKPFIRGVSLGLALVMAVAMVLGRKQGFTSLFGSKNEVGFFAELGVYASLVVFFARTMAWKERIAFGLIPLLVCGASLGASSSASSVVSLAAGIFAAFGAYVLTRLPKPFRLHALFAALFALATAATVAAALEINPVEPVLDSLGKDSTLTGRTYLWSEGIRNGFERPVLGHGYFGFWQQGRPEAEQYWQEFGIESKSGFHFHNLFIQTFVDFGFTGLALMVLLLLGSCVKSAGGALRRGMGIAEAYAIGLSFLFLVRAFVEVDLFGPFGIGPLMFYSILPRLAESKKIWEGA